MIKKGTTSIAEIKKGTTVIGSVYKGYDLVFESWKTLTTQGIPPLTINKCKNANMLGYKVYGDSKQQILPDGYTQLEYIESTGTQYIDTGINPDRTSRFELKFIQTTHNTSIMGAYSNTNNRVQAFRGGVSGTDSSFFEFRVFSDTSHTDYSNVLYSSDTKLNVVFDIKNLKGIVNGNVVNLADMGGGDISYPVWLFCANNAGSVATASNSKLYSYEHYKNDNLIQKLVPCKNSSNVVGMYDIVNGVFYQNAGTGNFTAGVKAPTPNAPIEIESVGDKTKNLWNSTLIAGCMKFADGQYLNYPGYVCNATPISVEAGQTYTISANNYTDPEQTSTGFVFYNNGTFVSSLITTSLTVTIPTGVNQLYYDFRKQSSASSLSPSDITNVQLEKGSSPTSYEPYGYKVPIKVSGQNIIDMSDTSYDFDEPVSMWASTVFNFTKVKKYFKPSTTYTISYDVECTSVPEHTDYFDDRYGFFLYSGVSGYSSIIMYQYGYLSVGDKNSYILTFTTPANLYDDNSNYRILGYSNYYKNGDVSVASTMKFSNIQIVEGSYTSQTMPSYEPYVVPRTTNIYLDEPLRKIGNGEVKSLPVGYTQLEYIESTGEQYIDTGFIPNQDTKIDIKFTMKDTSGKAIYGSRIAYDNSTFSAMLQGQSAGSSFQYNNVALANTITYQNNQSYNIVQDKNKLYINGTLKNTFTYGNFTCPSNLYLFAVNQNGTIPFYGKIAVNYCKIYNNGVLVRNFIPAKNSSNVVGMYDLVNNVFYTNQGTGTFTAGNEIYFDYIDLETQKVYRNVGHIDLGNPTYTYQSQYTRFRSDTISGLKIITGNWTYALMSDIYGNTLAVNYNIGAQGGALFVWDNRYTDPTDLKTALTGHYLDFALGATTETSITLPDILLNKGTNIIEVDTSIAPSNVWIKYKGKQ